MPMEVPAMQGWPRLWWALGILALMAGLAERVQGW